MRVDWKKLLHDERYNRRLLGRHLKRCYDIGRSMARRREKQIVKAILGKSDHEG